jgi:hypothetical protein
VNSISSYDQDLDYRMEQWFFEQELEEQTEAADIDDADDYAQGSDDFWHGRHTLGRSAAYEQGWEDGCNAAHDFILEERGESIDHATSWQWA